MSKWSNEDLDKCRTMLLAGTTIEIIADTLKRSVGSIAFKRTDLIYELSQEGKSNEYIGKLFNMYIDDVEKYVKVKQGSKVKSREVKNSEIKMDEPPKKQRVI